MRTMMILLMFSMPAAFAAENDALALRVKVALALSQSQAAACGECVFDEAEARAEAMQHRKPLVLLVGGCDGRGKVAVSAGAVACIVRQYDGSTEARIVVLEPMTDKDGWYITAKLKPTATDDELRKAIGTATPAPPKTMPASLDWDIRAEVSPATATPATVTATYTYCTKTGCYTVVVPAK